MEPKAAAVLSFRGVTLHEETLLRFMFFFHALNTNPCYEVIHVWGVSVKTNQLKQGEH